MYFQEDKKARVVYTYIYIFFFPLVLFDSVCLFLDCHLCLLLRAYRLQARNIFDLGLAFAMASFSCY